MKWILLVLFSVALAESFLALPIVRQASNVASLSRRSVRTFRATGASDHWKEKAIGAYSARTFKATFALALSFLALALIAVGLAFLTEQINTGFSAFLVTLPALTVSTLAATVYLIARTRWRNPTTGGSQYSLIDRVLHHLALGSSAIAEVSFDLDQKAISPHDEQTDNRHVFVAGLARAGTTILMRRLYATGHFCSLTYCNMPFVLAPNSFHFLKQGNRSDARPTIRAHGDGILVDVDSPESLDEVFWRIFDGPAYIGETRLSPHDPDADLMAKFSDYIAAILHADPEQRRRYLSKNNNNVLRLNALAEAFPDSLILIPFRSPASHAKSLLQQHRNFIALQADDAFIRKYMTWLVHHEFGLDHRPFAFATDEAIADPNTIEYWIRIWSGTYGWLEKTAPPNAYFVCYEDLCRLPEIWHSLARLCDVPHRINGEALHRDVPDADGPPEAIALYTRLRDRARLNLSYA